MIELLDVPKDLASVTYLCVGYPQEEHIDPELERAGWQERVDMKKFVFKRKCLTINHHIGLLHD